MADVVFSSDEQQANIRSLRSVQIEVANIRTSYYG